MRKAVERVVLFEADTLDENGARLAERFGAEGVPHFVLSAADGTVLDRWAGYTQVVDWLAQFESALSDPTPIAAKESGFEAEPTESRAFALGRIRAAEGRIDESVRYYREASRLSKDPHPWYAMAIFYNQLEGYDAGMFGLADLATTADGIFAMEPGDDLHRVNAGVVLGDLASEREDPSIAAPYVAKALEAANRLEGPDVAKLRLELRVHEALLVRGDKDAAFSLKKKTLPAGWEDDPESLNALAWWCFRNRVELVEAERLARNGIESAEDPMLKAALLDTAAEICNTLDRREEAAALIERAIELDPGNAYYAGQLARFRSGERSASGLLQ